MLLADCHVTLELVIAFELFSRWQPPHRLPWFYSENWQSCSARVLLVRVHTLAMIDWSAWAVLLRPDCLAWYSAWSADSSH